MGSLLHLIILTKRQREGHRFLLVPVIPSTGHHAYNVAVHLIDQAIALICAPITPSPECLRISPLPKPYPILAIPAIPLSGTLIFRKARCPKECPTPSKQAIYNCRLDHGTGERTCAEPILFNEVASICCSKDRALGFQFKIKKIDLANGSASPIPFLPTSLNIIVGPNNSGKSCLLREIRDSIFPSTDPNLAVVPVISSSIDYSVPNTYEEINDAYEIDEKMVRTPYGYRNTDYCLVTVSVDDDGNVSLNSNLNTISSDTSWHSYAAGQFKNEFHDSALSAFQELLPIIGSSLVNYCGTSERPLLAYGQRRFGPKDNDTNLLSTIQYDTDLLDGLSTTAKRLFGLDVLLDTETSNIAHFIVGDSFEEYRNSAKRDSSYLSQLERGIHLKDVGDGIKGFVATYVILKRGKRPIVLIDEPEAFLHPNQAYELGKIIGESLAEGIQIFVSTHSPNLIQGICETLTLNNCDEVTLAKLNGKAASQNGRAANILSGSDLLSYAHNPKLSHSSAIEGLFSEMVVLVESDADRIVYQRLLDLLHISASPLFVPTYSKDLMHELATFYRKFGVPCKAIVDLDIINDYNKTKKLIRSLQGTTRNSGSISFQRLSSIIRRIQTVASDCAMDQHPEGGDKGAIKALYKNILPSYDECPRRFRDEVHKLAEIRHQLISSAGLIILSTGELETVLENNLAYGSDKSRWISEAIDYLGGTTSQTVSNLQVSKDLVQLFEGV